MQIAQNNEATQNRPSPVVRNLLNTKQIVEKFPVFTMPQLGRMRRNNAKNSFGHELKWYFVNGFYYLEESEVIAWLDGCVTSGGTKKTSSQLASLEAARAEQALRRRKSSIASAHTDRE